MRAVHLLALFIVIELLGAAAFALVYDLVGGNGNGAIGTYLIALRAILGIDGMPFDSNSNGQQIVGIVAGFAAIVTPAILIGVVALRLFTVRPIVWREKIALCFVSDIRPDLPAIRRTAEFSAAQASDEGQDAVLQVRFYRRYAPNFSLHDVRATAYLRWPEYSARDGTMSYRSRQLDLLNSDGSPASERSWPQMSSSMPFSLFIPTYSPLIDDRLTLVQGVSITEMPPNGQPAVLVILHARVVSLNLDFSIEHRYDLYADLQLGRAVSINPLPGYLSQPRIQKRWKGWKRFDDTDVYGVFVYGSLVDLEGLASILGHPLVEGVDFAPATLVGYRRSWSISTNNRGAQKTHYYDPNTGEWPPIHVVFVNIEEGNGSTVDGLLIRVDLLGIRRLDVREGNYDRILVRADRVIYKDMPAPDTIWTYIGKSERVEATKRAIVSGSARIDLGYLQRLRNAFSQHKHMADADLLNPQIPVVELERRQIPRQPDGPH